MNEQHFIRRLNAEGFRLSVIKKYISMFIDMEKEKDEKEEKRLRYQLSKAQKALNSNLSEREFTLAKNWVDSAEENLQEFILEQAFYEEYRKMGGYPLPKGIREMVAAAAGYQTTKTFHIAFDYCVKQLFDK